ncbi:MAG TPA: hypothetical protein VJ959_06200 [Desulfotignum sp.]|nr:hypothetical protein [Desulfotignum sp.]
MTYLYKHRHSAGKILQNKNIHHAGWLSSAICIVLLAAFALTAGCAGSYGRFVSSPALQKQYNTSSLPDAYDYYYSGRSDLPYAVVGINNKYQFSSRLWFKIDTMDQVYKKISDLSDLHVDATRMRTADILDHKGNKIGVWFSYYYYTPVRINPETGTVKIFNPYDPNEDDRVWSTH